MEVPKTGSTRLAVGAFLFVTGARKAIHLPKEVAMSVRSVVGSMLLVVLLLLAAGPGLARGPQTTRPPEAASANASKAARAPWFTLEIDTPGDTGHYASVDA